MKIKDEEKALEMFDKLNTRDNEYEHFSLEKFGEENIITSEKFNNLLKKLKDTNKNSYSSKYSESQCSSDIIIRI